MKNILSLLLGLAVIAGSLPCNAEIRTWTSTAGSKLEAEFLSVERGTVRLKRANGSELNVKLTQLSAEDRKVVKSLLSLKDKGVNHIAGIGGAGQYSAKIECANDDRWHYYLYLPTQFHTGRKWPVCFVMSPGGGGRPSVLNRYRAAADRFGVILALSVESKNEFSESAAAVESMVDDIFERVPVIEKMAFSSGFSGGSRMAHLIAEREKRISAVLACGSGAGVYIEDGSFREARKRGSTYVYSLVGSNCFNRGGAMKSHKGYSKDFRLHYFPGNHVWASSPLIEQGMARVYGESLSRYRGSDLESLRSDYVDAITLFAGELKDSEPWEAYSLVVFLEEKRWLTPELQKLETELNSDDRVQSALEAEAAIASFVKRYYDIPYQEDQKPNDRRLKSAQKLASEYPDIPHGDLINRLGHPAK